MTSEELAAEVAACISRATSRVLGPGREQYELDGQQHFESMPLDELLRWAQEELDDVIVYAVMQSIRFGRLAKVVDLARGDEHASG
jgi:hypothetical protein